jgi:hypothetical protein
MNRYHDSSSDASRTRAIPLEDLPESDVPGGGGAMESLRHPGPGPEPLDEDELQRIVRDEIEECEQVVTDLADGRKRATDYYDGEPFGDEEEGRSKVVSRDVHDTVHAILPSIIRIFLGPENIAEFIPRTPQDVPVAEQMTDFINFVIRVDNNGFLVLHSAFLDALIRSSGVVTWWWDTSNEMVTDEYEELTPEASAMLITEARELDGDTKVTVSENPDGSLAIHIKRRANAQGRIRIAAIPPEEFLINRTAKCIDSARIVGHRRYLTVSDLVALGYDWEECLEAAGSEEFLGHTQEAVDRLPGAANIIDESSDEATRPVLYTEVYIKIDVDGDGIAELRKICCIGSNYEIVNNEPVTEKPFANFCPSPTPHTIFGNSIADQVMDVQRVKSSILRKTLDSLAQAIVPRMAIVEGQCNIADVLNNETGGPIRMRAPGMVQPLITPYLGKEAEGQLAYWDRVKEDRTGISRAAAGLDADALQSTTKAAVSATVNGAHQHIELIARIFAETGLKRMMRGLLGLACRHQEQERVIKLRNTWTPVNPAEWNADTDVAVNVAVGSGTLDERKGALQLIASKQEQILQIYGPSNPLVTVSQYRNTLAKLIEMAGFVDPGMFLNKVDQNWQPPPPQPKEPTPEEKSAMILAQVQADSIKADIQMKAAELDLKKQDMLLKNDRERDLNESNIYLKARELELKYQTEVDLATIQANIERDRMANQFQEAQARRQHEAQQQESQGARQQDTALYQEDSRRDTALQTTGIKADAARETAAMGLQGKMQQAAQQAQQQAPPPEGGPDAGAV